ncbi:MAG TPA: Rrf2 family transcriptional regulator [Acidimicrobiales bacterium]|jgi:Rrf2 family protein|nr:Rrf2 family transcriptional regulator [Acidimicrobiales bacterium]
MQLGQGVEWAVHCCTLLALVPADQTLPAARLAEYHGVPPAYLAKHLQSLAQAGIVESTAGRRGGYRLAKSAPDITLLDVVDAVEGSEPAFRCTEIRRRGPARVGAREYGHPCGIASAMARAEAAYRVELERVSIADLLHELSMSVSPVAVRKAAAWFQEVLR